MWDSSPRAQSLYTVAAQTPTAHSLRGARDRVRDAHVVQFTALAEAVHRGRGNAEPCTCLFDRKKRAEPNRASHRCPDHGRTKILGKSRERLERIG
jgi:hypothetical protein